MDHVSDRVYCTELANQALEVWFDRTWDQIEPVLAGAWDHGEHAMPWSEAAGLVKRAWTEGLGRGAVEFSAAPAPRVDVPSGPRTAH